MLSMIASGNIVYVPSNNTLNFVDVTDRSTPQLLSHYEIQGKNIDDAFKKLESKIRGGNGDILVLQLESLDDKNKINFYKINRSQVPILEMMPSFQKHLNCNQYE